mmetsp:Transcript_3735/g.13371  ORF Transcript_3735/g.13371 Transcript_3735/m.13371 type:complete len:417 (+) Transcript_3735:288-1538(+)|eukprot:scaffold442_cov397-Prasinococcus_capsulatus_cf.AAC.7
MGVSATKKRSDDIIVLVTRSVVLLFSSLSLLCTVYSTQNTWYYCVAPEPYDVQVSVGLLAIRQVGRLPPLESGLQAWQEDQIALAASSSFSALMLGAGFTTIGVGMWSLAYVRDAMLHGQNSSLYRLSWVSRIVSFFHLAGCFFYIAAPVLFFFLKETCNVDFPNDTELPRASDEANMGAHDRPLWISFNGYGVFIAMYGALLQLTSCALVLAVKYTSLKSQKYTLITHMLKKGRPNEKRTLLTALSAGSAHFKRYGKSMRSLGLSRLHSWSQPHSICNGVLEYGGINRSKTNGQHRYPFPYPPTGHHNPSYYYAPRPSARINIQSPNDDPLQTHHTNDHTSYSDSNVGHNEPHMYACHSDGSGSYAGHPGEFYGSTPEGHCSPTPQLYHSDFLRLESSPTSLDSVKVSPEATASS